MNKKSQSSEISHLVKIILLVGTVVVLALSIIYIPRALEVVKERVTGEPKNAVCAPNIGGDAKCDNKKLGEVIKIITDLGYERYRCENVNKNVYCTVDCNCTAVKLG